MLRSRIYFNKMTAKNFQENLFRRLAMISTGNTFSTLTRKRSVNCSKNPQQTWNINFNRLTFSTVEVLVLSVVMLVGVTGLLWLLFFASSSSSDNFLFGRKSKFSKIIKTMIRVATTTYIAHFHEAMFCESMNSAAPLIETSSFTSLESSLLRELNQNKHGDLHCPF